MAESASPTAAPAALPAWAAGDPEEWLRHVLSIHFDPRSGTPYWLEQARRLGIDPLREIRRFDDLVRFGPMDSQALARRPLTDFVPRSLAAQRDRWVVVETGGTTGDPRTTLYLERELDAVFVQPFTEVALRNGFPRDCGWLYAGPSGPHVIGRAARRNARALGAADPFTLDFDPRWAKLLAPDSMARRRYLEHIVSQAARILRQQEIGVLFTTPLLLEALGPAVGETLRRRIRGVFYGGMAIDPALYRTLSQEAFPEAVHLAGYGNTLLGLALQQAPSEDGDFDYFYPGWRIHLRWVEPGEPASQAERLAAPPLGDGQEGQLVACRLDESFLILNLFERDRAQRLPAPGGHGRWPLVTPGLRNPRPLETPAGAPARSGFY